MATEEDVVQKEGDLYRIEREVIAIEFVRKHTTVPVPKVLQVQLDEQGSRFSMQRVTGESLEMAWLSMTEEAQRRTTGQLRHILTQLRKITVTQPGLIGSCDNGPSYDHRINNRGQHGPFASVAEFNDFLVAPVRKCPRPERALDYRRRLSDSYEVYFTHADLGCDHIFVEPQTGRVTGIIDWEMAGFWPEWWEYRKALYTSRQHTRWWVDLVRSILPHYDDELELDSELEDY